MAMACVGASEGEDTERAGELAAERKKEGAAANTRYGSIHGVSSR
jgi:hypothetical protein